MSDQVVVNASRDVVTGIPEAGELVYFNGNVTTVCKMVFGFTALTILTLGIYRFWAKTKLRQYFWSQTKFDGDRFEYHGTPKELFIGFLIVVAILAPIFFILEFVGAWVSTEGFGPVVVYQVCYLVAFLILIQLAVYRMTRYRLTRSSWRGVRFGLDGNSWRYTGMAIVAVLASVLSLGLAYPWMRHWLIRYRIENMRFGGAYFEYGGTAMLLAKRWWITISVSLVPLIIAAVVAGIPDQIDIDNMLADIQASGESKFESGNTLLPYAIGWFASFATFFFAYIWYRVGEFRIVLGESSLGETHLISTLHTGRVIGLYALIVVLFVCLFLAIALFFTVFNWVFAIPFLNIGIAILLGFVGYGTVTMIISGVFGTLMARAVLTSIRIYKKHSLIDIAQGEWSEQKYGEGLADAFDVGAF